VLLQFGSLSSPPIDAVVSITMATFTGGVDPTSVADDIALIVSVLAELTPNAASAWMKYVGIVAVCVTWITLAFKPTTPQPVVTVGLLSTHFNIGKAETVCMFGVVFTPTTGQVGVPAVFEL
jgi:hypothetical protein